MELALPLLTTLLLMIASCGGCKVDQCTRSYNIALDEEGLTGPVASPAYCHILHNYGQCVKETAKKCRGNLRYHTVTSVLRPMNQRYNCSQQGKPLARPAPKLATEPPPPPPPVASCTFNGRHIFRHCGLFGDPHLKTFNNEYQTCRVQGAWPLIDNPYLAVQVTNEPVFDGSPATATTKVTVIIKGRSTPCTTEKTYEATGDSPLPASFIDGTYRSDSIVIAASAESQPERVEIFIRYIETTILIRRVGKYLAFSAKLPEDLVESSMSDDDNLQLCSKGCPPAEKLDLVSARGHAVSWETALSKCRQTDQLSNEILNNLTDYYIDWCVFDAMTAGEGHGFTAAAHSAQADVLRLDPGSLQNRTTPLEFNQLPISSSSSINSFSINSCVLLIILIIIVNRVIRLS